MMTNPTIPISYPLREGGEPATLKIMIDSDTIIDTIILYG